MSDYRFVDFDDQRIALLVNTDGSYELHTGSTCTSRAAEFLFELAVQLEAVHPPYPCNPSAEPDGPKGRPAEPIDSRRGRLDRERSLWTDGRGHLWDLSLVWGDVADRLWRWHGSLDSFGAPLLRTVDGTTTEPLDVVRAVYGPLIPVAKVAE
ncbi:hypothetical protein DMA15_12500 [Streptomyces sp. WAC 01529]|uniref:phiSA1p31-related protein n=1 Tax=Streptomyces sp. WAC 01529 TaxID=2203205 RepID=UPI000F6BAEDB|nr:phiSA1p31-related protein [Streptomyces sp. WAC 01529]AZM53306.1 hypothetical protein DMA15_12500 [Streptomyces sp. WAC 01529]